MNHTRVVWIGEGPRRVIPNSRCAAPPEHGALPRPALGRLEIVEALGAGRTGEVYRATNTFLDCDVAVEVVLKHLVKDRDYRSIAAP